MTFFNFQKIDPNTLNIAIFRIFAESTLTPLILTFFKFSKKSIPTPLSPLLGEMAMLQKNILQRQENLDKTVENAEKIKEDSRIFSQSTGKLVEKVGFFFD